MLEEKGEREEGNIVALSLDKEKTDARGVWDGDETTHSSHTRYNSERERDPPVQYHGMQAEGGERKGSATDFRWSDYIDRVFGRGKNILEVEREMKKRGRRWVRLAQLQSCCSNKVRRWRATLPSIDSVISSVIRVKIVHMNLSKMMGYGITIQNRTVDEEMFACQLFRKSWEESFELASCECCDTDTHVIGAPATPLIAISSWLQSTHEGEWRRPW